MRLRKLLLRLMKSVLELITVPLNLNYYDSFLPAPSPARYRHSEGKAYYIYCVLVVVGVAGWPLVLPHMETFI